MERMDGAFYLPESEIKTKFGETINSVSPNGDINLLFKTIWFSYFYHIRTYNRIEQVYERRRISLFPFTFSRIDRFNFRTNSSHAFHQIARIEFSFIQWLDRYRKVLRDILTFFHDFNNFRPNSNHFVARSCVHRF